MSPNGDGDNDFFVIQNIEFFKGNILNIYNRWGNLLYETTDYQNDWAGDGAPDGTYFYTLHRSAQLHVLGDQRHVGKVHPLVLMHPPARAVFDIDVVRPRR